MINGEKDLQANHEVVEKAKRAKSASVKLSSLSTEEKNEALLAMAHALEQYADEIIEANQKDLEQGKQNGISQALLDRLALNQVRIEGIADGLRQIVELPDPIGEVLDERTRPNGMRIVRKRVPIGLIGMIYEARPNVTVDAAGLCLKTGNAVVLRGGSSAIHSNQQIVQILHRALEKTSVPIDAIQLISSVDRQSVQQMLKLNGLIDVIIPRGGASLIQNVIENATVPVIETGAGICHTYIDEGADHEQAFAIAMNAKVQRPSVCNAMETLLVHKNFADPYLPTLGEQFKEAGVTIYGCKQTKALLPWVEEADETHYATEYNDMYLNIKIVESVQEAIDHIRTYGTMHSECIITPHEHHARLFMEQVDAAVVYHNVSTRFTDGFEFGYGAEIGISTQKLHTRGPMGLPALTSEKYYVYGHGQIRS